MNHRDYLKRRAVKTKSNATHNAYKKMRNQVNKTIKNYYRKCIDGNKNNPKKMWKSINQLIGRGSKTTHITWLNLADEEITDETKITDTLNTYFTQVGPDLANQLPKTNIEPEAYMNAVEGTFSFKTISINDILGSLNKQKSSKSLGPNKISARLLKDSRAIIAPYLALLSLRASFQMTGKKLVFHLSINQVTKKNVEITDLYPCYQLYQKYLRNWFT